MSQFTLTAAEDLLVVSALKYVADVQRSYGSVADDMDALLAKIAAQQNAVAVVEETMVEETIVPEDAVVEPVAETEVTA